MALRKKKRGSESGNSQRSRRDWLARGVLALGFLGLGYYDTANSLANVIAKADPARAHAMAPSNGVVLSEYSQEAFTIRPSMDADSLPARLARRALLDDPTAAEALTVLGFQALLRDDTEQADKIFRYSIKLSRRELRPRIWAIEEAVTRGDIAGALKNYDIALRTSGDAAATLYPTLVGALSEPRIRRDLLRILASRPVWKDSFVAYAANSGIEPEGTIALFQDGEGIGLEATDDLRANIVNALVSEDKVDKAWIYYRSFRAGTRRDRSRDAGFILDANIRAVFDWRVGDDKRLAAAILPENDRGVLDFVVPPSIGGVLVTQTQFLPPGVYRLRGSSRGLDQPERSRPYWALTCSDGRELGRVPVPNSVEKGGRFSGRFVVLPGCEVQTLSLIARPSDDIMGVAGQILEAELTPANGSERGE